MKKLIIITLFVFCSASFVFAVSITDVYDTSWEYNILKHDKTLSQKFSQASYEIEFDDDYSFSLELDYELKRNATFTSRNDMLSSFLDIFSEYKTFEIKGLYQLNADGSISVFNRNDKEILTFDAARKNRTLSVKFQDGTILDFKKN